MTELEMKYLDEYKSFENLLNDIYGRGAENTSSALVYSDLMQQIPYNIRRNFPYWEQAIQDINHLRMLRNSLVHDSQGQWDCMPRDLELVRSWHKDLLNQTDPLSLAYKLIREEEQVQNSGFKASKSTSNKQEPAIPYGLVVLVAIIAILGFAGIFFVLNLFS